MIRSAEKVLTEELDRLQRWRAALEVDLVRAENTHDDQRIQFAEFSSATKSEMAQYQCAIDEYVWIIRKVKALK